MACIRRALILVRIAAICSRGGMGGGSSMLDGEAVEVLLEGTAGKWRD